MFENRILRQSWTHAAYRTSSMTGLAIVLKNARPPRGDSCYGALSLGVLLQGLGFPYLMLERQVVRRTGMIPCRQIARQELGFVVGQLSSPVHHLFNRGFPSRARQSLLYDQIRTVADGTARNDQGLRTRTQSDAHGIQVVFLSRSDGNRRRKTHREKNQQLTRHLHHALTITVTRSHPFHRNPLGFHGLTAGCSLPRASVARQTIVNVPRSEERRVGKECRSVRTREP